MNRLGIVTALAAEAAIARRAAASPAGGTADPIVRLSGPGPDRAGRAARDLIGEQCDALLSFGVAGGLDPALRPGTVVLADGAVGPDRLYRASDAPWRDRLRRADHRGTTMTVGTLASTDRPLRNADDKASLFEATGAIAVDMESFAVACAAHDAKVPFLAIRAIADPAWRAVPEAAIRALGPDGRTHPLRALGGLLARPWEAWEFAALARDSRAAFAALRRVAVPGTGLGPV